MLLPIQFTDIEIVSHCIYTEKNYDDLYGDNKKIYIRRYFKQKIMCLLFYSISLLSIHSAHFVG